jgi:transcriptional regulator with XRE-family HTH domain
MMENLDREIGDKLRKLREQKNLTMREVAEATNIDYTYISKIEKGKIPSLEKLKKLCNLYGIQLSSLFGNEIDLPNELKNDGVKWITFGEEMEKRDLTPDEIKKLLDALKIMKNL